MLDATGAELVSGRFADETGRSINGRFASVAQYVTRRSVWIAQSESASFYRRELLERIGGFDEGLGIGSSSQWQAAEGPDLILRALGYRAVCYYDPSLYGFHHEYDLDEPTGKMAKKGRVYGRGMGHVLRVHHYGIPSLVYWASRPLATALLSAVLGRFNRMVYSLSVSLGRIEGWTGRVWNFKLGTEIAGNDLQKATNDVGLKPEPDPESKPSFDTKLREMTGPYNARNPLLVGALYAMDVVASLLPKRQQEIGEDRPLRVLVANWGHLGDVLTILPLLKYLEHHPQVGELGLLIGSWSRSLVESSDITARIHIADHWALDRSDKSTSRKVLDYFLQRTSVIKELRECQYDMSIDTFSSFPSTHAITWGAAISRRVGFTSSGFGRSLTDPFDWIPNDQILLDHQLKLLKPLLGSSYPQSLPASYPGFVSASPERVLSPGRRPYIVIHMGPQDFKGWNPEKWISLARTLQGQGYDLIATGGPGREMDAARSLSEKISVRNLTGQLSWAQFVTTVANANAVITVDSVTGHVAACFGVPAVVLTTGRTRLSLWRPNNANIVELSHSVGCAPCHRTRGCAAMACVRRISVEDVLSSLQQAMESERSGFTMPSKPITASH